MDGRESELQGLHSPRLSMDAPFLFPGASARLSWPGLLGMRWHFVTGKSAHILEARQLGRFCDIGSELNCL